MKTMSSFNSSFWILCTFIYIATQAVDIDCEDKTKVPGACKHLERTPPSDTFKDTGCATQIKNKTKGNRPEPCQYFSEEQIKKHLQPFHDGAAYIVKNFIMEHHNWNVEEPTLVTERTPSKMTEWIGMEYGQYVGTLETYKKMLEQVDLTLQDNDDKSGATQYAEIFDTTLGFPKDWSFVNPNTTPDSQKEKMTIVLVVIKGYLVTNYIDARTMRMPSGNEIGANKEWIPGGYLPTGKPEAVIDAIPKNDVQLYKIYEKGKFLSNQYDAFPYTRKPIQPVDPCKENKLPPSATFYISDCAQYIKGLDKKKRPEPQTYFSEEQYNAHLQQFVEKGAAYITRQHQMEHYNYDMCIVGWKFCGCTKSVGRPTDQFVSLYETYQDMMHQVSGGDGEWKYRQIFDATLGFAKNDSFVNEHDVSIILIRLTESLINRMINEKAMRIPSGKEEGANPEWLPGGYLPTGLPEVVVDAIPKEEIVSFNIYQKKKFIKPMRRYQQSCFAPEPPKPSGLQMLLGKMNRIGSGKVGAKAVQSSEAATGKTATGPKRVLKSLLKTARKCVGCKKPKT
eukprot:8279_1